MSVSVWVGVGGYPFSSFLAPFWPPKVQHPFIDFLPPRGQQRTGREQDLNHQCFKNFPPLCPITGSFLFHMQENNILALVSLTRTTNGRLLQHLGFLLNDDALFLPNMAHKLPEAVCKTFVCDITSSANVGIAANSSCPNTLML